MLMELTILVNTIYIIGKLQIKVRVRRKLLLFVP